jgi:sulfotransferase family protein
LSLPNFFVVGANRAGTTAMYSFLSGHPDIYMSPLKEPSFFALYGQELRQDRLDNALFRNKMVATLEAYQALFTQAAGRKAIGEASTAYLQHPAVPARIKSYAPDGKVLAILRDPAERAFSNYALYRGLGLERARSFRKALGRPPKWRDGPAAFGRRYIELGFYASAVRRYYEAFGRDRVRIYLYEDWTARPRNVLGDVLRFLEVDDSFVPDVSKRYNDAIVIRSHIVARYLDRWYPPGGAAGPLRLARWLRAWNRRTMRLKPTDRQALIEVYRQDVVELQDLLGRDLSAWLRS